MTLYSKCTINGTDFRLDVQEIIVNKSLGNGFASGRFVIKLNNYNGKYKDTFNVNDDVQIYLDTASSPTNVVFRGFVENITPELLANNSSITLSGRDYMGKLMDITALESYSNTDASAIVTDLQGKYLATYGITANNVVTSGKTVRYITFKRKPLFECLLDLSKVANMNFYVDNNKDIHFETVGTSDSGVTLDNSNTVVSSLIQDNSEMYNSIWVYGGRYLSGWRQTFTGDGAGSAYTLNYEPADAQVLVSGAIKQGHIFNYTVGDPPSGAQYLVDVTGKQLVFVSGTNNGNNVVGSLVNIQIDYQRQLPVVKLAQDEASISNYGQRDKFISNSEIVDPRHAEDIAKAELAKFKLPARQGVLQILSSSIVNLNVGQLITMNHPNLAVNSEQFTIIGLDYFINKDSLLGDRVVTARLNNRIKTISDTLAEYQAQIQELQAQNATTGDVITRLQQTTGSLGLWYYYDNTTRTVEDSFVFGHPQNGVLGTSAFGDRRGGSVLNRRVWMNNTVREFFKDTKFRAAGSGTLNWDTANGYLSL